MLRVCQLILQLTKMANYIRTIQMIGEFIASHGGVYCPICEADVEPAANTVCHVDMT